MNTGLDAAKTASKKVVHKAGEFFGNKIADAVTKSKDDKIEPEKRGEIFEQIEKSIIKIEHYKIFKLFNDSSVSKFVSKKWVEVNDLSSAQYSASKNINLKLQC